MGLDEAIERVRNSREQVKRWREERETLLRELLDDFISRCESAGIRPSPIEKPEAGSPRDDLATEGWPIDELNNDIVTMVTVNRTLVAASHGYLHYTLIEPYDPWILSLEGDLLTQALSPEFANDVTLANESCILALEDTMAEFLLKRIRN